MCTSVSHALVPEFKALFVAHHKKCNVVGVWCHAVCAGLVH